METPLSTPGRSGPGLSSNVKPPQPGEPIRNNWRAIVNLASAASGTSAGLQTLKDLVAAQPHASRSLVNLFPFAIYQIPSFLRVTPDPATDWLKFRIRAGRVMETNADGTDSDFDATPDSDPDSEYIPLGDGDINVPTGTAKFWFWLEIGDDDGTTTAIVRYGPDPTAESYSDEWETDNPWDIAPRPDGSHVPIGWVDTLTNQASRTPIVRQYLRSDLVFLGGECP